MTNPTHTTPDQLIQMLKDVIQAGKATGLIKGGYLKMMDDLTRQVPKKYALQQYRVAQAVKKAANKKD